MNLILNIMITDEKSRILVFGEARILLNKIKRKGLRFIFELTSFQVFFEIL